MRLYLASIYTSNYHKRSQAYLRSSDAEKYHRNNVRYYLESYHYIHKPIYAERIRNDGCRVFVDSGAYSAFAQGVSVDLPAYVKFLKDNDDIIERVDGTPLFSVLDDIRDPLKTYQNQQQMESLGVRPLPCFHYGEDERWLTWYMQHYDYITIGGMVPISTPQLYPWLDRIWSEYLVDGAGRPRVRVHGFGLTNVSLMERYPWFSVDSSSWVQMASNGSIWIPEWGMISVSDISPAAKMPGRSISNIPESQAQAVCEYVARVGYDMERLRTDYIARWSFNCWSFTELNNRTNRQDKRFLLKQRSLFRDEECPKC